MALHFYTEEPQSRMVRINGKNLREGDSVGGGVTLEEITPDGVALGFQGYHFLAKGWTSGRFRISGRY